MKAQVSAAPAARLNRCCAWRRRNGQIGRRRRQRYKFSGRKFWLRSSSNYPASRGGRGSNQGCPPPCFRLSVVGSWAFGFRAFGCSPRTQENFFGPDPLKAFVIFESLGTCHSRSAATGSLLVRQSCMVTFEKEACNQKGSKGFAKNEEQGQVTLTKDPL